MSSKWIASIIVLSIILLACFIFINFEIKSIPDDNLNKVDYIDFIPESKRLNGLFTFVELLKEKYGKDSVLYFRPELRLAELSKNQLFINIQKRFNATDPTLLQQIRLGKNMMIISSYIDFEFAKDDYFCYGSHHIYDSTDVDDDAVTFDSIQEMVDTLNSELDSNDVVEADYEDEIPDYNFANTDSIYFYRDTSFEYVHKKLHLPQHIVYNTFNYDLIDRLEAEVIITDNEENAIFVKYQIGKGYLMIHLIPEMFSNQATSQDFYLSHFNKIFSEANFSKVFLTNYNIMDGDFMEPRQSPLKHLLGHKSLASAYYLLLLGFLFYIVFNIKRKKKAIPLISKPKNTSLEFVDTLSKLYEIQDQNEKLAHKMAENFFIQMKAKYYIDKSQADFTKLLSRKSKIDEEVISEILTLIARSERENYLNDEDLTRLYLLINKFNTNKDE